MSRDELVAKGRSLGVERPELMTRVELGDEIVRRTQSDPGSQRSARGWLGIARDLVASVVESGLNLPDAAAVIRGERAELPPKVPAPVATVTLAEIYATQGHADRALHMLDEVLEREPDHPAAKALRARLQAQPSRRGTTARVEPLEPELDFEPRPPDAPEPVVAPPAASARAVVDTAPDPALGSSSSTVNEPEPASAVNEPSAPVPEPEPPLAAPEAAAAAPEPASPFVSPPPTATPALLILRTGDAHPAVCWEVASLEVPEEGARLELECLGFSAVHARSERREVKLRIDSLRGKVPLSQFDADTIVRAALGYRSSGAFVPVAIASELVLRDGAIDVRFRPPLSPSEGLSPDERALVAHFTT